MILLVNGQPTPQVTGIGPWVLLLNVLNDDGTPLDLTGHTLDLAVRDRDQVTQLIPCTVDPTLGAYGVAQVTLPGPLDGRLAPYWVWGVVDAQGAIQGVDLVDPGGGYQGVPGVTVTDPTGSGAYVQALLAGATLGDFQVVAGGDGYEGTPLVLLSGGSPSTQGAGYALIGGPVTGLQVTTGYYQGTLPTLQVTAGGQGTGLVATLQVGLGVTNLVLLTGGTFSTTPSQVTIQALGGGGAGFVAQGVISGTHLVDVHVIQAGEGYTQVPSFTCVATGALVTTQPTFSASLGVPEVTWDETFYSLGGGVPPLQPAFYLPPGGTFPGLTVARLPTDSEYATLHLTFNATGGVATASLLYAAANNTGTVTITPLVGTSAILGVTAGSGTVTITQPGSGILSDGYQPGLLLAGASAAPATAPFDFLEFGLSDSSYGEGDILQVSAGYRCGTSSTSLSLGGRYWTGSGFAPGTLVTSLYDGFYVGGRQQVTGITLVAGGANYSRDSTFSLTGGTPAQDRFLPDTHLTGLTQPLPGSQVTGQVARQVIQVVPTAYGEGYQGVPTVQVQGGTTPASVTATLRARLDGFQVLAGGNNYRNPQVVLSGSARGQARLNPRGGQSSPPTSLAWSPLVAS